MERIFGRALFNKNMATEIAPFLEMEKLAQLLQVSRRFREIYSQEVIWWTGLATAFPRVRVAQNILFKDEHLSPMTALSACRQAREIIKTSPENYALHSENTVSILAMGQLGHVPRAADISRVLGPGFDLLSSLNGEFLFENKKYFVTMVFVPWIFKNPSRLHETSVVLLLANRAKSSSRADAALLDSLLQKDPNLRHVMVLENKSEEVTTEYGLLTSEMGANPNSDDPKYTNLDALHQMRTNHPKLSWLEVKEFTNRNVSLMFNHLLRTSRTDYSHLKKAK